MYPGTAIDMSDEISDLMQYVNQRVEGNLSRRFFEVEFNADQLPDFIVATVRMREFTTSEMWRFPNVSTTTSVGQPIIADVAGPPSPEKPRTNVPATTVTRPVLFVTFKIAPSWTGAKNMFPAASREMPLV